MSKTTQQPTPSDEPQDRLRHARERSEKGIEHVASLAGMDLPAYRDLETFSDEIAINVSLHDLRSICDALAITPQSLFQMGEADDTEARVSPEEFVKKLREKLQQKRIPLSLFEDEVGFQISECFDNPNAVMAWNVDCLRAVCAEIGVDWLTVL